MEIHIEADANAVANVAAKHIARMAREAVAAHGEFFMAVSGGNTPWQMLKALGREDVPWKTVHIFQVDERVAPAGDPDRNLTHLNASLLDHTPIDPENIHAMPVDDYDLNAACRKYIETLQLIAGTPPLLDLVHLGMGNDGHTASLVPGDPALEVIHADVSLTGIYQGRRRMTLTYPIINRSRKMIWMITGTGKAPMFRRFQDGDKTIPAGQVNKSNALVIADQAAAG